jgi:hypothetical protein
MTSHQTGLRAAGAWLAGASILLALALAFHGPLHPDIEMQMARIAESASRWAAVHWTAAAAFTCFTIASVLVLVSGARLTSAGRLISAWAVVLVGALWTLIWFEQMPARACERQPRDSRRSRLPRPGRTVGSLDVRLFSTIMTLGPPGAIMLQELRVATFSTGG